MNHKKRYKALMMDLDGTLVKNAEHALPSKSVIEAVNRAGKYLHTGIATGRPVFMIENILKSVQFTGVSIVNDGAQIIDVKTRKVYAEKLIHTEDLPIIEEILHKEKVKEIFLQSVTKDIPFDKTHTEKVFAVISSQLSEKQCDSILGKIHDVPTLHAYKFHAWEGGFGINITPLTATKQHGILEVAQILDIRTDEIIGIGDSYNDFPLLMACGLKVAMGNAVDEVKAIADYIAPSVDNDGVADVIGKFILDTKS